MIFVKVIEKQKQNKRSLLTASEPQTLRIIRKLVKPPLSNALKINYRILLKSIIKCLAL